MVSLVLYLFNVVLSYLIIIYKLREREKCTKNYSVKCSFHGAYQKFIKQTKQKKKKHKVLKKQTAAKAFPVGGKNITKGGL